MRSDATQLVTGTDVRGKKILVVGAGGIGCELVKNLVLTGFDAITMIDLDTIDYSNLNRQFLFRARHVGRSKAEVAREAVLGFPHDALDITAQHGNIKSKDFDLEFFKRFDIVLNALDNVDARRHVNRVCLAAEIPLVESGTQGYLGQVRAIIKGKTQCYECNPPTPQKTYPVCTIRNHPDKPIHCIVWAKELLLKKLFGGEETDLVDSAEGAADGDDDGGDGAEEPAAGAPAAAAPAAPPATPLSRCAEETAAAFAARVFSTVFEQDVERLLRMDALWKERTPPTPLRLATLSLPDAAPLLEDDQRPWTIEENAAVFLHTVTHILEHRAAEVGSLKFDKDDPDTLDFVAAASNLRASVFGIPRDSRWDIKEMAGNIIPAIATTNAIIAGWIVLEALKILGGRADACRYCVCNRHPSGRKRDILLQGSGLDAPNPECMVCSKSPVTLSLDTSRWTVGMLIDLVIKKHFSFNKPTIDATTLGGESSDQLCEGVDDDELDEEEIAKYKRYRDLPLGALPQPVVTGSVLAVEDMSQALEVEIAIRHEVLDAEEVPSGFVVSGVAAAKAREAAANAAAQGAAAEAAEGGQKRKSSEVEPDGRDGAKKPRAAASDAHVVEEDDDCVILD